MYPAEKMHSILLLWGLLRYRFFFFRQEVGTAVEEWVWQSSTEIPRLLRRRQKGFAYITEHMHNSFVILYGESQIYTTPVSEPSKWTLLYQVDTAGQDRIVSFEVFGRFLVLFLRRGADAIVRVINSKGICRDLPMNEECYSVRVESNPTFDANSLRLSYSSLITPNQLWSVNMASAYQITALGSNSSRAACLRSAWCPSFIFFGDRTR